MIDTHYSFIKHLRTRYDDLVKEYKDCIVNGSEPMQFMTCAGELARYMTDSNAACTKIYIEKEDSIPYPLYTQINGVIFYGIRRDGDSCQLIAEIEGYRNGLISFWDLNFAYLFNILITLYFYLFYPKTMLPGIINWYHYNYECYDGKGRI